MKNYFFDFDGTLADSGETAVIATQAAFKDQGLPEPSSAQIRGYMGIPIEKSFVLMGADGLSEAELQEMFTNFRKHYQANETAYVVLFPEIKETLLKLKKAGKRLYVVSSKHSEALKRNLELLDIDIFFDDLVGSDQVDNYKPAPDGIKILLERYDLDQSESVMIGDAIYDIQMGQAAGIQTAGVHWGAFDWDQVVAQKPTFALEMVKQLAEID
ncbi:HAD family hydrolase [Ligilactobacillus apodemi]|uniref:Phosphatase n=1 Tax=Ligilactobacillus apodemi DSM 16634 = JCM 16172 TaxID=1423724 RepID=A0A0R1TUM2_9LACO|nr:HAD family hydrolase [Ligilactobacillus apodemi]KRL84526.1 phosphatase [Ligilactobacillus apodemi DSM 16634 = JCM 16172]MCR1901458.1 HAD family hydrolase [Ligilactobacillus apodemi]